jgi:hypothetical protein
MRYLFFVGARPIFWDGGVRHAESDTREMFWFADNSILLIRINSKTTTSRRRIAAKECFNGNRGDINYTTQHDTCAHLHAHNSTFTNALA